MQELLEVCWHGRGGQGAKTASYLLAESALAEGYYIQAFPEYGPERMGAPIRAFTRLSRTPIRLHCHVRNPQVVVVLDPTLLEAVDVLQGVPPDGKLLVNTEESPEQLRQRLGIKDREIYTVPATKIALETIERPIPNIPMLGALIKALGSLNFDQVKSHIQESFSGKFSPAVVEGNLKALERAYEEVRKG